MKEFTKPTGQKTITLRQDESAHILLKDLEAGSRDFELRVNLEGEKSSVKVYGLAKTVGKDQKNWKVVITLYGKEQSAELDLRGVADDNSLLRFDGCGIVAEGSEEGEMEINEKVVLFSPQARAHALPVLRVETENVKSAGHGATIAPFDEEMFFYLESRGVAPKQGKKLLLEGFLKEPV